MSSTDPLRGEVDTGRTRDKVDFPDPAAAPLGTDDEAAGRPPSAADVALARSQDATTAAPPSLASSERGRTISGETRRPLRLGLAVAVAVAAVAVVAVGALVAA
jgi:hypothetical protein